MQTLWTFTRDFERINKDIHIQWVTFKDSPGKREAVFGVELRIDMLNPINTEFCGVDIRIHHFSLQFFRWMLAASLREFYYSKKIKDARKV